jgi:hypothetical protein
VILSCVEQKFKDDKSLHVMGFSKKIFFLDTVDECL